MTRRPYQAVRSIVVAMLFVMATDTAVAQENSTEFSRHAVYVEFFGHGILYSVNYDFRLTQNLGFRAGFSHWTIKPFFLLIDGDLNFTAFPILVNYLTDGESGHLELGIGFMPAFFSLQGREIFFGSEVEGSASKVVGAATLGYRWQPQGGGVVYRIGVTPLFTFQKFMPTGGASIGIAF